VDGDDAVTEPETVPSWVLTEVGRLHLHSLALERALDQTTVERDQLLTDSQPAEELTMPTPGPKT
jgi:hypothetical protein